MAITHRTGPIEEFDPHKMRRGEWAFPYNGEAYYCVSPGNVKRVATKEEIIGILETNQEAYDGLQQLLTELESETVLTGILNDISTLLDDVALNKSNIVSNTQDIVNLDDKVNTHMAENANKHITESGSNENGSYIKFDDGTMICTFVDNNITDQAIDAKYGSLFLGSRIWTFPSAFINRPAVTCSEFTWGTSASWGFVRRAFATSAQLRCADTNLREEGTSTTISVIAIGRWK